LRFLASTRILRLNQDNLRMKFSAQNVGSTFYWFKLRSPWFTEFSVRKRQICLYSRFPFKMRNFGYYQLIRVKTVAARHRLAAYRNKCTGDGQI